MAPYDYYDDYYPPRRRRRRRPRAGLIIFALILVLALVFVWRFTEGFTSFAGPELKNVRAELSYSLETLAGEIRPEMRVDECGVSYLAELDSLAAEEPDMAERLNFIADHLEIYTEDAVKTALAGEEKLDFALLMPFRGVDAGGGNAVITVEAGEIPYLIQYDTRWAYHGYGSSVMGVTGCGPTCLSMAAIGLTGDASLTPARVAGYAESAGHYVPGAGTAWTLFTTGAADMGLRGEAIAADEEDMKARLDSGQVLAASMLPGDFTTTGHFILIVGHGMFGFSVYDPNSVELSRKAWSFEKLQPQIAQLWALSAAPESQGQAQAGSRWYAECEEFITLRAGPDVNEAAVATIPAGGEMIYIGPAGDFACVEYNGQRGYVLASYIRPVEAEGPPAAPEAQETGDGGGLGSIVEGVKDWLSEQLG